MKVVKIGDISSDIVKMTTFVSVFRRRIKFR